jgi:hypothetical protein
MLDVLRPAMETLGEHVGPAFWALAVFACGFGLAVAAVRLEVRSLLAFPLWLLRLAKRYLRPELSPVYLFAFIFLFNTLAIFCYMASGGLIWMPIVFDLLTGLNVGAVMLKESAPPGADDEAPEPVQPPRAWVGFLGLFVVIAELSSFWLAIGMGMKLGHLMRSDFAWETYVRLLAPRATAYALVLVPALAAAALAETAAIKAMLSPADEPDKPTGLPPEAN